MIASKNWTLNTTAAARKKSDGGVTGQSTTSTPKKFDAVSRRNSTAPGSMMNIETVGTKSRPRDMWLSQVVADVDILARFTQCVYSVI